METTVISFLVILLLADEDKTKNNAQTDERMSQSKVEKFKHKVQTNNQNIQAKAKDRKNKRKEDDGQDDEKDCFHDFIMREFCKKK